MSTDLLHLSFRLMTEKTFSHLMNSSLLISDVKAIIKTDAEIAPENQRLIFKGQLLKDEFTLKSYGVESGSTIHVVGRTLQQVDPEASADTTQSAFRNENETGERADGASPEGQNPGNGSRGFGLPMGLFMSPIYATISVSTPVPPNAPENSMEHVATQFFSGVVNSLLTSFNSTPATVAQSGTGAQPSQPRDELVSELERSTGVLKRVTNSVRSLSASTAPVSTNESGSGTVPGDMAFTIVTSINTNEPPSPATTTSDNPVPLNNVGQVSNADNNVQQSGLNNSVLQTNSVPNNLEVDTSNVKTHLSTNGQEIIENSNARSNFPNEVEVDVNISKRMKRSNSEIVGGSSSLELINRSNSMDGKSYSLNEAEGKKRSNSAPVNMDSDSLAFKKTSSNEFDSNDLGECKSTSNHQNGTVELNGVDHDEYESRRNKVLLMDPELVTSKLPWNSLKKLESVYELNSRYSLEYSDSVSYSANINNVNKYVSNNSNNTYRSNGYNSEDAINSYTRRSTFVRRPSFSRTELPSLSHPTDESMSSRRVSNPLKNGENSEQMAGTDEIRNLNEFLSRLSTVNNKFNELISKFDIGDRNSQIEMYKSISSAMAIECRIYASLCAIFMWMHTQMLSPDVARRFSNRMGWNGSNTASPLLQNTNNIQTPIGNFTFATFSTDGIHYQSNSNINNNSDTSQATNNTVATQLNNTNNVEVSQPNINNNICVTQSNSPDNGTACNIGRNSTNENSNNANSSNTHINSTVNNKNSENNNVKAGENTNKDIETTSTTHSTSNINNNGSSPVSAFQLNQG